MEKYLKLLQTFDNEDYEDNDEFVDEFWSAFVNFVTRQDLIKMGERKQFSIGFIRLCKNVNEKFLLRKNNENFFPLYLFTSILNEFLISQTFVHTCIEENFIEFLAENCLFNNHFEISTLGISDDEFNFGPNKTFYRHNLFFLYLNIFNLAISFDFSYMDENVYNRILSKINSDFSTVNNPVQYEAFTKLSITILHLEQNSEFVREKFHGTIIGNAIEHLMILRDIPMNLQLDKSEIISLNLRFIIEALQAPNLNFNFEELLNDFAGFLSYFHFQFHGDIFNSIFHMLDSMPNIQKSLEEAFPNLKILKNLNVNDYEGKTKLKAQKLLSVFYTFNTVTDQKCIYDDKLRNKIEKSGKKVD